MKSVTEITMKNIVNRSFLNVKLLVPSLGFIGFNINPAPHFVNKIAAPNCGLTQIALSLFKIHIPRNLSSLNPDPWP